MRRLSCVVAMLVVLAGAAASADGQSKAGAKAAATVTTPININTATAAQLEALPGIGARTAQAIVEHRQKNGGFKKIEEILESSRLGLDLLRISHLGSHLHVSRSRRKPQEISPCIASGGRSGGRTLYLSGTSRWPAELYRHWLARTDVAGR
jgi:competence ComEA-like helix-hairpin-helix protein